MLDLLCLNLIILDHRTSTLWFKMIHKYKVKWKDFIREVDIWENITLIYYLFPCFKLQECNYLERGEYVMFTILKCN